MAARYGAERHSAVQCGLAREACLFSLQRTAGRGLENINPDTSAVALTGSPRRRAYETTTVAGECAKHFEV
jgi:hypothetical protein